MHAPCKSSFRCGGPATLSVARRSREVEAALQVGGQVVARPGESTSRVERVVEGVGAKGATCAADVSHMQVALMTREGG